MHNLAANSVSVSVCKDILHVSQSTALLMSVPHIILEMLSHNLNHIQKTVLFLLVEPN